MIFKAIITVNVLIFLATSSIGQNDGTYENPISMGHCVNLGDGWIITVLKVINNATDFALPNGFASGNQYSLAYVDAKYTGSGAAYFDWSRLYARGASREYDGIPHNEGMRQEEVPTDGSIEGCVVWKIDPSDSGGLRMYDGNCLNESDRIYLALYYTIGSIMENITMPINATAGA